MNQEAQQRILGYFIEEAREHLTTIEQGLLSLRESMSDPELINELFRAAHSIKGGAAMLSLGGIQRISHRMEDFFNIFRAKGGKVPVDQHLETLLLRGFDALSMLLEELQSPRGLSNEVNAAALTEMEPIFAETEAYINRLLGEEPLAPTAAPRATADTLQTAMSQRVPQLLREMLDLFKQREQPDIRERLGQVAAELEQMGVTYNLPSWQQLTQAVRAAIARPDTDLRNLALIVLRDLKQGQQGVLENNPDLIKPSAELRALAQTAAPIDIPPDPVQAAIREEIPQLLRQMLDLFKRHDQAGIQAELLQTSRSLETLGQAHRLDSWLQLTQTVSTILAKPDQDLKAIAMPILRDLKQGSQALQAGNPAAIQPSPELLSFLPVVTTREEPDLLETWEEATDPAGDADLLDLTAGSELVDLFEAPSPEPMEAFDLTEVPFAEPPVVEATESAADPFALVDLFEPSEPDALDFEEGFIAEMDPTFGDRSEPPPIAEPSEADPFALADLFEAPSLDLEVGPVEDMDLASSFQPPALTEPASQEPDLLDPWSEAASAGTELGPDSTLLSDLFQPSSSDLYNPDNSYNLDDLAPEADPLPTAPNQELDEGPFGLASASLGDWFADPTAVPDLLQETSPEPELAEPEPRQDLDDGWQAAPERDLGFSTTSLNLEPEDQAALSRLLTDTEEDPLDLSESPVFSEPDPSSDLEARLSELFAEVVETQPSTEIDELSATDFLPLDELSDLGDAAFDLSEVGSEDWGQSTDDIPWPEQGILADLGGSNLFEGELLESPAPWDLSAPTVEASWNALDFEPAADATPTATESASIEPFSGFSSADLAIDTEMPDEAQSQSEPHSLEEDLDGMFNALFEEFGLDPNVVDPATFDSSLTFLGDSPQEDPASWLDPGSPIAEDLLGGWPGSSLSQADEAAPDEEDQAVLGLEDLFENGDIAGMPEPSDPPSASEEQDPIDLDDLFQAPNSASIEASSFDSVVEAEAMLDDLLGSPAPPQIPPATFADLSEDPPIDQPFNLDAVAIEDESFFSLDSLSSFFEAPSSAPPEQDLASDPDLAVAPSSPPPVAEDLPNLFEAEPVTPSPIGDFEAELDSILGDLDAPTTTALGAAAVISPALAAASPPPPTQPAAAPGPAAIWPAPQKVVDPRRTPTFSNQTMRVEVRHLDSINNLVGEMVVNRNSLEQNQSRLRQFLDGLLTRVQSLSDLGQQMRDQYDRSLLESALLSSRGSSSRILSNVSRANKGGQSSSSDFDSLEMDRFTSFHALSQEIIELIVRVRESASDIQFGVDEAEQVSRQFRQVTTQLQESLNRARMVPFSQIADRLPRAIRDLSIKTGKQVSLVVEGRDTLIDKAILEELYDPMTHLVNNALVHGVELPEERRQTGKSPEGKITVRAFYQGNQTIISVSDDGAGINVPKVRDKALRLGLIGSEADVDEVYNVLFNPGFSARSEEEVDDLAGRGVGLDVVRRNISELRGNIQVDSVAGQGTTFIIRLPLTLSISKAMVVVSNRSLLAFPLDGVEEMLDVPVEEIEMDEKGRPSIPWRNTRLHYQPLSDLLSFSRTHTRTRTEVYSASQEEGIVPVVVLQSNGQYVALQVDSFVEEQEIVIKQLRGPVPKPPGIAGATVLGNGRVLSIVDIIELVDMAHGRGRRDLGRFWAEQGFDAPAEEPERQTTVLIIDDSITVRELLSMTFGKVGYRVEQARDGQDAWEKLRGGLPCDLVFCDIEMPRMDGLELLSRVREDPNLSHLPFAMLTSRGAERHRQTARELGATAYFTKPYLEEELLSSATRMLRGERLLSVT